MLGSTKNSKYWLLIRYSLKTEIPKCMSQPDTILVKNKQHTVVTVCQRRLEVSSMLENYVTCTYFWILIK